MTPSSSSKVRALLIALANSAISGWPTAASNAARTASNGLEDITLKPSTSTRLVVMIFCLMKVSTKSREAPAVVQLHRAPQDQKLGCQQVNRLAALIEYRASNRDDSLLRFG